MNPGQVMNPIPGEYEAWSELGQSATDKDKVRDLHNAVRGAVA